MISMLPQEFPQYLREDVALSSDWLPWEFLPKKKKKILLKACLWRLIIVSLSVLQLQRLPQFGLNDS